jgi:hypothetical protein
MNLETIEKMWENDSQLDNEKLDYNSIEIPKLHAKYLRLYNQFTILRDEQELRVKRIYLERWEYYTGKSEEPFHLKILKQDVNIYLDADETYQKGLFKLKHYNLIVSSLKDIITAINNRSFQIKNAIEFAKFLRGHDI